MKQKAFVVILILGTLFTSIFFIYKFLYPKDADQISNSNNQNIYTNNWYGYSFKYPVSSELYFSESQYGKDKIFIPENEGPRVFLSGKDKKGNYKGPVCDMRIFMNRPINYWSRSDAKIKSEIINGIKWDVIYYKGGKDFFDSSLALWHTNQNGLVYAIHSSYESRNKCRNIATSFQFTTNLESEEYKVRSASEKYVIININSNLIFLAGSFIDDSYIKGGTINKSKQPTNTAALIFDDKDSYIDHQSRERTLVIMKKNDNNWVLYDQPENSSRYISN